MGCSHKEGNLPNRHISITKKNSENEWLLGIPGQLLPTQPTQNITENVI